MRTVYDLMVEVAKHLVGEPVRVNLSKPEGLQGCCWRNEKGQLTVDINPCLYDKTMLYVFLHELGHGKFHTLIPVTEAVRRATPLEKPSLGKEVRESQADYWSHVWLEYGEKHRNKSLDYFEGCLFSLLDY